MEKYKDLGILFISPIIGMTQSLTSTFNFFTKLGANFIGIDVFDDQKISKSLLRILNLTILPWSNMFRIRYANNFNEEVLFNNISNAISKLKSEGKTKIIIGGMSGGFIFASRFVQKPPDDEVRLISTTNSNYIKGLFGISPLIFYPSGVNRIASDLSLIPNYIPTLLVWGDNDTIVPKETIHKAQELAKKSTHIKIQILAGEELGLKSKSIRHQFFGGEDFIKPFTNIFWNKNAELATIDEITNMISKIK